MGNTPARDSLRKSPPGPCCMLCGNTQACTRSPGFVFPTSRWTHHQKWGISEVILAGGGGNNLTEHVAPPSQNFFGALELPLQGLGASFSPGSSLPRESHMATRMAAEQRHPHILQNANTAPASPYKSHIPRKIQGWAQGRESHPHFPAAGGKLLQLSAGSAVTPVEIKENLRCRGEPSRSL